MWYEQENENKVTLTHFEEAIALASRYEPEDDRVHPRVGVVIVKKGRVITSSYRNQTGEGDHAEFIALKKSGLDERKFRGADLITTLEPCTEKRHGKDKNPCARWIELARIRKVWIGALDENPEIRGKAMSMLLRKGIKVSLFPEAFYPEVIDINSEFFDYVKSKQPMLTNEDLMSRFKELRSELVDHIREVEGEERMVPTVELCNELKRIRNKMDCMDVDRSEYWNELGQALLRSCVRWKDIQRLGEPPYGLPMRAFRTFRDIVPHSGWARVGMAEVFLEQGMPWNAVEVFELFRTWVGGWNEVERSSASRVILTAIKRGHLLDDEEGFDALLTALEIGGSQLVHSDLDSSLLMETMEEALAQGFYRIAEEKTKKLLDLLKGIGLDDLSRRVEESIKETV